MSETIPQTPTGSVHLTVNIGQGFLVTAFPTEDRGESVVVQSSVPTIVTREESPTLVVNTGGSLGGGIGPEGPQGPKGDKGDTGEPGPSDWDAIPNVPEGLVSSSAQVDYTHIQNQPTVIPTASWAERANLSGSHEGEWRGNLIQSGGQGVTLRFDGGEVSGSYTVDWNRGNHQSIRLGTNTTLGFTNPYGGGVYSLEVAYTGPVSASWPNVVTWSDGQPPFQTMTVDRKDVFTFFFDGTNYLGQVFGYNYLSS